MPCNTSALLKYTEPSPSLKVLGRQPVTRDTFNCNRVDYIVSPVDLGVGVWRGQQGNELCTIKYIVLFKYGQNKTVLRGSLMPWLQILS